MLDITERLQRTMDHLKGFPCECDPSVGAVPCEVCGDGQLALDAKREIEALRRRVDMLKGGLRAIAQDAASFENDPWHIQAITDKTPTPFQVNVPGDSSSWSPEEKREVDRAVMEAASHGINSRIESGNEHGGTTLYFWRKK